MAPYIEASSLDMVVAYIQDAGHRGWSTAISFEVPDNLEVGRARPARLLEEHVAAARHSRGADAARAVGLRADALRSRRSRRRSARSGLPTVSAATGDHVGVDLPARASILEPVAAPGAGALLRAAPERARVAGSAQPSTRGPGASPSRAHGAGADAGGLDRQATREGRESSHVQEAGGSAGRRSTLFRSRRTRPRSWRPERESSTSIRMRT